MLLLQDIGRAYQSLSHYKCHRAVEQFSQLPRQHYNTPWVLVQIGKAYFEMNEQRKAEEFFKEAHELDPHNLHGNEYFGYFIIVIFTFIWLINPLTAMCFLVVQKNA
jgi:anaphase-promoting complex subunit 3